MAETRKGEVTFKGNPIELVGPKLKAGDKAPEFSCVGAGLSMVPLADTTGKARLFNVVPSLGMHFVPELVTAFKRDHPGVHFRFVQAPRERLHVALLAGDLDACIACHKFGGQGNDFGPDLAKLDPCVPP